MVKIHYHLMVQSYLIPLEMNLKIDLIIQNSKQSSKLWCMVKNVHVNYVC